MDAVSKRNQLRDNLIESFGRMPEIWGIYAFGREVHGVVDEYSDIDIVFCSLDPAATQEKYWQAINMIAPIVGACTLVEQSDVFVEMLMLEGYSPYQKIDLCITSNRESQHEFGPFTELYRSGDSVEVSPHNLRIEGKSHAPQNQVNDLLFSIPRFTKCLFRRDRDMYRRWSGTVNRALCLLYEKHFGWSSEWHSVLTPPELKALHDANSRSGQSTLDEIMPINGQLDLTESFRLSIDLFLKLCDEKATACGWDLDKKLISFVEEFLQDELERYRRMGRTCETFRDF